MNIHPYQSLEIEILTMEENMKKGTGKRKAGKAKGKGKAVKLVKKQVGERFCPCGCGEWLSKSSQFRIGHDGRLHGMFTKVEKGKAKLDDLTPLQQSIYALHRGGMSLRDAAKRANVPAEAPSAKDDPTEPQDDPKEDPDEAPVAVAT